MTDKIFKQIQEWMAEFTNKQAEKDHRKLESFVKYCTENPELRFWQALRAWANVGFINISNDTCEHCKDTYYIPDKN